MAAATSNRTAAPGGLATLRLKSTLFQENPARCSFRKLKGRSRSLKFDRTILNCRAVLATGPIEAPVEPPFVIQHTKLFINSDFVDAASGKTFSAVDPRLGEVVAEVAEAGREDVDKAVKAACKAFEEGPWPRMPGCERARILNRVADKIEEHMDELSALDTISMGKVYDMGRLAEAPLAVGLFRYYAGWCDKIHGMTLPTEGPFHAYTLHEPIGVVGSILPWNAPLYLTAMKLAPALACGNTIVLKPAEQSPLSALLLAKLASEAGLPEGVLNVVTGKAETGKYITSHMDIDKVAFTGSTEAGRDVMQSAARSNLKPVTLELGGKSPMIIFDDADMEASVEAAHQAIFYNQGQMCVAGSRTFVHEKVYDEYIEKAKARAQMRVVGDPFKAGVEQGPQVDSAHFDKVMSYIQLERTKVHSSSQAVSEWETRATSSNPPFLDNMRICQEEIFGPVMAVIKFKTVEEVIRRANASDYGLGAAVMSKNIDTVNTLTRALKAGTIWVNTFGVLNPSAPFGGYKLSGFGRENGAHVLANYQQVKSVIMPIYSPTYL